MWQCWQQFPTEFEFGENWLLLLYRVYVNRYTDDFLYDISIRRGRFEIFSSPQNSSSEDNLENNGSSHYNSYEGATNGSFFLVSVRAAVSNNLDHYLNTLFLPARNQEISSPAADQSDRVRQLRPSVRVSNLAVWDEVHSYGLPLIQYPHELKSSALRNVYTAALVAQRRRYDLLQKELNDHRQQPNPNEANGFRLLFLLF